MSSHRFLALWILYRCLRARRLYRLVPFVYMLSVTIHLLFATVTYGGLAVVILTNCDNWLVASAVLVVVLMVRCRHGLPAAAALVGALTLLPNPSIVVSTRLLLCIAIWMVGLVTRWECRTIWAQFHFKPFYLSNINQGSAKILKGDVHVVHLFVNASQKWCLKDMQIALASASQALAWLVSQAARYKVRLRFKEHVLSKCEQWPQAIPNSNADMDDHHVFGEWLNGVLDCHLSGIANMPGENLCLIVHVKDRLPTCLAYAVPKHRFRDQVCRLEYTVVGAPHDASVFAHELLHLFGADDFYFAAYWGRSYNELPLRQQLLNDCIMFTTKSELSQSFVDDLTAQNIGWM